MTDVVQDGTSGGDFPISAQTQQSLLQNLPGDLLALLGQEYTDLRILVSYGNSFSVEGRRNDTGILEMIESSSLNSPTMVRRLRKEFDLCAADPSCPIRAVESSVSGNQCYFRYAHHGTSLFRKFVHDQPYIANEDGLGMLTTKLPAVMHRDAAELNEIIETAIMLCDSLQKLHDKKILHNGINPHSTFICNGEIVLHGRCVSSNTVGNIQTQEEHDLPHQGENLLPYLSPESSGRTNRQADLRSDIYSVGCLLYELTIGRPPFVATDTLSFIHRHLTAKAPSIDKLSSSVPPELAAVLAKCLEKSPDLRYQSVAGLRYDLMQCLTRLSDEEDPVKPFQLAYLDDLLRFNISQALCGREEQIQILKEVREKVRRDRQSSIVLIIGVMGIGKTTLLENFRQASPNSLYTGAQYEQYRNGAPFSTVTKALQSLVRQVLTLSSREMRIWRAKLLVDKNLLSVIVESIPEIRVLLGDFKPLPVKTLSIYDSAKRFCSAFVYVMSVFTSDRCLTCYQDNVEWASQAEVDLIVELVSKVPGLLMILTRRPIVEDDLISFALDDLVAHDVPVVKLEIPSWTHEDINVLLQTTLHGQRSTELDALVPFVFDKTKGNPRLVAQLLQNLYRSGKIYFQPVELKWRFNIKAIGDDELTDNIIDGITAQMKTLGLPVQRLLVKAAALGQDIFTAGFLSRAIDEDLDIIAEQLRIAVDRNILKLAYVTDKIASPRSGPESSEVFGFLHDKTQESAYKLASYDEQLEVHYKISANIQKHMDSGATKSEDLVFLLANQYNNCLKRLSQAETYLALESNLEAGKLAMRNGDSGSTQYYLEVAEYICEKSQNDVATRLRVRFANIELQFAASSYDRVLTLLDQTMPHCTRSEDRTRCAVHRMKALIAMGRLTTAIDVGLQALDELKCPVPANDQAAEIFAEKMAVNLQHTPDKIMAMATQPQLGTDDSRSLEVQAILSILVLPVYMTRPRLLAALCYLSVSITASRGPSLQGAYPALMLGAYLSSISGKENLLVSYAYGRFALALLEASPTLDPMAPGMYHVYAAHIAVFHSPMSTVIHYEDLAIKTGKELFNPDYTAFGLITKPVFLAWCGRHLVETSKDIEAAKSYILSTRSDASNCFLATHMSGVAFLLDQTCEASEISSYLKSDDPGLAIHQGLSITHAFMWEIWRLLGNILLRDVEACRSSIQRCCADYLGGVRGTHFAAMAFYLAGVALSFLAIWQVKLTDVEVAILEQSRRMLHDYAVSAPSTYSAKAKLLETLQYRCLDHSSLDLLDKYDAAIEEAEKYECLLDHALALESAGRWLETVSPKRSITYLRKSYASFKSWGCIYKTKLLEAEYSWLRSPDTTESNRPSITALGRAESTVSVTFDSSYTDQTSSSLAIDASVKEDKSEALRKMSAGQMSVSYSQSTNSATEHNGLSELDIKTVLNASIQISKGLKAEEVFENLMETVLLAAGADYGVLALNGMDEKSMSQLSIHTIADTESISLIRATRAHDRPDLLPLSIVNTVLAIQKPIIRNDHQDTVFDNSFARDRYYLSRNKPLKSVLCMPIPSSDKEKLRGILYLENNATSSAFTTQRLECLTLLCTQSAMTLERAGVYHEMQVAKAQAEEATAQKSTFLANMSHEIRTPFNALLSCAIFLLDTNLSQVQKDYVLTIRDSATLTLSIIDGILDFSKVEQGMMDLVFTPFLLSDTIETAMQIVAEKASKAGVDLVYSQKHDIDKVIGDSLHLRQVVLNLLGNAVKFTSHGYVKVTSSYKAALSSSHRIVSIIVEDTGIGISSKGIDRLFKAFSQVDASINRSFGGTGLGLAISKKLMELMGGKIWLESIEGEGTKFFLELVLEVDVESENERHPRTIEQSKTSKNEKRLALVISRFQSTADVLVDDLNDLGFHTEKNTSTFDVQSVITQATTQLFSLIFLDLQVVGAVEMVKALQTIPVSTISFFKIIILTNHGLHVPPDMSDARIWGYLVKPIPKSKLRSTVSAALSSDGLENGSETTNSSMKFNNGNISTISNGDNSTLENNTALSILLAEDNIINTKVALQHLKRLGYTDVVHAKDGIEVLELCATAVEESRMFDLILMDVQMPRLDGIGATEELLKRYPKRSSRPIIIALTANATSNDKERCMDAGMSGHLSKPILPDDLLRMLRSIEKLDSNIREDSHAVL